MNSRPGRKAYAQMTQPSGSSGDAVADRRFDMARQLLARGDGAAAADLMRQAMELTPRWAEGQFTLADTLMQSGAASAAAEAFRAYLALDPADSMGAGAKLALLGETPGATALSPAYLTRLFDQYAPRFDKALVDGLGYSAPAALRAALDAHAPGRRYARALDLGCGTGLMGAAVRDRVTALHGVDLSARMLAQARRKGTYDALVHGDLLDALADAEVELVLAADVLVYVGELTAVVQAVHRALTPGGIFAFTVQAGDSDVKLGPDQRFSHSADYLRRVLSPFDIVRLSPGTFRREAGRDVPGLLVVAARLRK